MPTIVHFDHFLIGTKDLKGNPGVGGGMGERRLPGQTLAGR